MYQLAIRHPKTEALVACCFEQACATLPVTCPAPVSLGAAI